MGCSPFPGVKFNPVEAGTELGDVIAQEFSADMIIKRMGDRPDRYELLAVKRRPKPTRCRGCHGGKPKS